MSIMIDNNLISSHLNAPKQPLPIKMSSTGTTKDKFSEVMTCVLKSLKRVLKSLKLNIAIV